MRVDYTHTIPPSNPILVIYPHGNIYVHLPKDMDKNIHSYSICKCPQGETTQEPNRYVNDEIVIQWETIRMHTTNRTWINLTNIMLNQKDIAGFNNKVKRRQIYDIK